MKLVKLLMTVLEGNMIRKKVKKQYFYYFAFGSNINTYRLKARRVKNEKITNYNLEGYELIFNAGEGYANIQKKEGESVPGVIYRISSIGLRKLDMFEGVFMNCYTRVSLPTQEYGNIQVYIATPTYIKHFKRYVREKNIPIRYLHIIREGYKQNNITPPKQFTRIWEKVTRQYSKYLN